MNILVVILSLGIFTRGLLYYIVSYKPMNSKFNLLSITNNRTLKNNEKLSIKQSENAQEYADNNKIAGKAYVFLGIIFFLIYLTIGIIFSTVFENHYLISAIIIIIVDYFINILVAIKLKITEWDKNNVNKN